MAYVFISYDKGDAEFAEQVKASLQMQGFTVWIDSKRLPVSDDDYQAMIREAIAACAALVAILPAGAPEGELVKQERAYAGQLGKPVFGITTSGDVRELAQRLNPVVSLVTPNPLPQPLPADWEEIQEEQAELYVPPPEFHIARWVVVLLGIGFVVLYFLYDRRSAIMAIIRGVTPASVYIITPTPSAVGANSVLLTVPSVLPSDSTLTPTPPTVAISATDAVVHPATFAVPLTATVAPSPTDSLPVGSGATEIPAGTTNDIWTPLDREFSGLDMVYVPAGCFLNNLDTTGSDQEVCLDAFWIGKTEVTNAQYAACVGAGACSPPEEHSSASRASYYDSPDYANYPVIHISWDQAQEYSLWRRMRLPTQDQWRYAAQGPADSTYPWGEQRPDSARANFNSAVGDTTLVGGYPDGQSWVGALDMAGNVWEWTSTVIGGNRVVSGGAWNAYRGLIQSSYLGSNPPDFSSDSLGFRVLLPG